MFPHLSPLYPEPTARKGKQRHKYHQRPQAVLMPAAFGFRGGGLVGGHEEKYLIVRFSILAMLFEGLGLPRK